MCNISARNQKKKVGFSDSGDYGPYLPCGFSHISIGPYALSLNNVSPLPPDKTWFQNFAFSHKLANDSTESSHLTSLTLSKLECTLSLNLLTDVKQST